MKSAHKDMGTKDSQDKLPNFKLSLVKNTLYVNAIVFELRLSLGFLMLSFIGRTRIFYSRFLTAQIPSLYLFPLTLQRWFASLDSLHRIMHRDI